MTPRLRTAVLISGRGSNMLALVEAARQPDYPAEIVLVLSNRAQAQGLEAAREQGIEAVALPHRDFADRAVFDAAMSTELRARGVQLIALAGFMRILTPAFIAEWQGRIVNIHPSLLPKYPGLDTHGRAIAAGDAQGGCSVHVVTEILDDGPVIAQAAVPLDADETAKSLAAKVLLEEHRLYPTALAAYARTLMARTLKVDGSNHTH